MKLKSIALAAASVTLLASLSACSEDFYEYDDLATPEWACAIKSSDGKEGRDAKIEDVYYPGEKIKYDYAEEVITFVPCNPRNLMVNDGTVVDGNGDKVGDRYTQTVGYTKEGTMVLISWSAFWMLNQSENVMRRSLYPLCSKYSCGSEEAKAGSVNNSTEGWNDMLGENNMPASDSLLKGLSSTVLTNKSWMNHDQTEWNELAGAASKGFAEAIRPYTGFADDIFCGSGSVSGWDDPNAPGKGEFTCGNVRFVIDDVVPADKDLAELANRSTKAAQEKKVNQEELAAAKNKYGPDAGYWLGLQDTLELCNKNASCIVSLGGNGSTPNVTVPRAPASNK